MKLNTRGQYPTDWPAIAQKVKEQAGWKCVRCGHPHEVETGYVLTVHHFNGDKSNCAWWNLMPLCQRCHLSIQARVDPETPFFLEHSTWAKPYVAGFYAHKYLDQSLTRTEAINRQEELLSHEQAIR